MDPITAGTLLMKFAPTIAGWFGGDDAEEKVGSAVNIAKKITGADDPDSAVTALEENPELALKFEKAVMAHEAQMEREKTRRIEAVNQTMQAESKSEHWMQWSWRPFNGFMFGVTLFSAYVVLPAVGKSIDIPEFVLVAWASVLGVAAWHRGMGKREVKGGGASGIRGLVERTLR